jgi:hypothetical protein
MQVIQVLSSDTYRVADVAVNGRHLYSTTAHVSELKSWKVLQEDEDELCPTESQNVMLSSDAVESSSTAEEETSRRPVRNRRPPAYIQAYDTTVRGRSGMSGEDE